MIYLFLILNALVVIFSIYCLSRNSPDQLSYIGILEIVTVGLVILMGCWRLLDFTEGNQDSFIKGLVADKSTLNWLIAFTAIAIIHTIAFVKILFRIRNLNTNK